LGRMDSADWDVRYGTDELVWRADPNRFLVEEVGGLASGKALDLACGEGRNALWLAAQGWEVTAVDFSAVGLAKAGRLASARGLRLDLVEADLLTWAPQDGAFDLVIVMYLHLPEGGRRQVLRHAADALVPGGTVLVVGHDITNLLDGTGGPQDPGVLYSPDDVIASFDGLEIVRAARVRRPVSTEEGERTAIDALVRARRPLGTPPARTTV
jgi:SAM-dependent methyltransferase